MRLAWRDLDDLRLLELEGAPVRAGFTTRLGGMSSGPFASFNLDPARGDDPIAVRENREKLLIALDAEGRDLALAEQVHGTEVAHVRAETRTGDPVPGVDALAATGPGLMLGILTADCLPAVIFEDKDGDDGGGPHAVVVHAGWRGLLAGIIENAVETLLGRGARLGSLRAVLGPAIGPCCYAVPASRAAAFAERFGPSTMSTVLAARRRPRGPLASGQVAPFPPGGTAVEARSPEDATTIDLEEAAIQALAAQGVARERILGARLCTSCERELFFSFRRDEGMTGRQLTYVIL